MKNLYKIIVSLVFALSLACCINNDIPYPRIQANFLSFNVKGQDGGSAIDSLSRTVTVTLPEEVDIYSVTVSGYSLTPGAHIVESPFERPIDLSTPITVVLSLYQDYSWRIIANQNIERYFEVSGQVGETTIDVPGRRIVLSVSKNTNLSKLKVERAKLANEGSIMTPDIAEGGIIDARKPVEISVEVFDHKQLWTLYVETVESTVSPVSADAWTCVAWVKGEAEAGKDNGIEYRLAGTDIWTKVEKSNITTNGGSFTACIPHLSPQTSYQTRAYSDQDYGEIIDFTTGSIYQMPNSDFDSWWLDGKIWCPWAEGGEAFWGTGNQGAATLGQSNSIPTDDTPTGQGWAAKLETRFVGIGIIGKLAAGNLFAGVYVKTDGTNGILSFGRPTSERPTKLRGMYKYTGTPISHSSSDFTDLIGQPDTCIVWCALIDSAEPFEIRTNPKNRQLFDPDGPEVVAYGKMEQSQTITEWIPFEFELNYKSTSRVPKYILVTCSASKYGDYFTGGNGSILYVDDFELVYDY